MQPTDIIAPDSGRIAILDGLADIDDDLTAFGVSFDRWYRESSLVDSGALDRAIQALRKGDHVYQQDGAWWFRATAFGDRQDRVVIRENGEPTYFASDVAYHLDKLERGYDRLIDIWGADHHGYIDRIRASLRALHGADDRLTVLLVQFATRLSPRLLVVGVAAIAGVLWLMSATLCSRDAVRLRSRPPDTHAGWPAKYRPRPASRSAAAARRAAP